MDCKLIRLDIDGTLLNSKHRITESTKKVISIVSKEKGIPVVLISARMPKAMTSIKINMGFYESYLICPKPASKLSK